MERGAFQGSGFFDVKYDYTNRAKKVLDKYGKEKIIELVVSRIPLDAPIQRALEFVNKQASQYYDTLFHLGLIAKLESGKKLLIEKNQTIDIEETFTFPDTEERRNVPLKGRVLLLHEFLDNTQSYMGKHKYFEYNAWNNNCQVFVSSLLTANNLNSLFLRHFILQDLKQIIETTPYLAKKFANFITGTAGWYRKITGYGEPIFYDDMEKSAFTNTYFRNVKYTAPDKHMQVVYMSIKPREEIPKETHKNIDQFFKIEYGKGKLLYGDDLQYKRFLKEGEGFLIPKGTQHVIKNSSYDKDLKLFTIYSPANHPQGYVGNGAGDIFENMGSVISSGIKDQIMHHPFDTASNPKASILKGAIDGIKAQTYYRSNEKAANLQNTITDKLGHNFVTNAINSAIQSGVKGAQDVADWGFNKAQQMV